MDEKLKINLIGVGSFFAFLPLLEANESCNRGYIYHLECVIVCLGVSEGKRPALFRTKIKTQNRRKVLINKCKIKLRGITKLLFLTTNTT